MTTSSMPTHTVRAHEVRLGDHVNGQLVIQIRVVGDMVKLFHNGLHTSHTTLPANALVRIRQRPDSRVEGGMYAPERCPGGVAHVRAPRREVAPPVRFSHPSPQY